MKLIEQEEKDEFFRILARYHLIADDFVLQETDTTDPQTDEIQALAGFVVVVRKSTMRNVEYPIGDGVRWLKKVESDIVKGAFGTIARD